MRTLRNILSFVLIIFGIFFFFPALVSYYYGEDLTDMFIILGIVCIFLGIILRYYSKTIPKQILRFDFEVVDIKSVVLSVILGWLFITTIGAFPYFFSHYIPNTIDCYFESVSGFTTTGATILSDIESLPNSLLFWRALTHWLGGMGIILLIVAVLPSFGSQAIQLFQSEVSGGGINKKITPRIKKAALFLLLIYTSFTVLLIILLMFGGLSLFDSSVHSFSTIATGGLSSKNLSIGYYESSYVQYIIAIFMIISGVNFVLYCRFLTGEYNVFKINKEFKFFIFLIIFFTAIIFFNLFGTVYYSVEEAFRYSFFQVASLMTTTGFTTADYSQWPEFSKMILFILFFIGGCVGSTSGSIKTMRIFILLKSAWIEVIRVIHPSIVKNISIEEEIIPHKTVRNVLRFITFYMLFFFVTAVVLSSFGLDFKTAITGSAAMIGNVGPAFGSLGPMNNYSFLSSSAKLFLCFVMFLGRLEIFTVIVLFTKDFWKK
jgi:trk system potassium uptake protein